MLNKRTKFLQITSSAKMALPLYNGKFILLISASFITIFSSIAIYFCLPILISHVIRTQLSLSPNSGSYNDWRLNSVIDRIYLYNITNLNELFVMNEAAKHSPTFSARPIPKIKQIGPFTFRQDREKINIKFNPKNETVMYDQKKSWTYIPELSVIKTLEDLNSTWIHHMNIPLAGTTLNAEYAEFIEPIVSEFDLKLFLNHSVNALLFEGYHDILMEGAKSQGQIDVDRFGWMFNLNNSITENINIFTGPSNASLDKLGTVDHLNYKKRFNVWHDFGETNDTINSPRCNYFAHSSAGEFFPPPEHSIISHNNNYRLNAADTNKYLDSKSDKPLSNPHKLNLNSELESTTSGSEQKAGRTISLLMHDICRVFKLVYSSTFNYRDLSVDRYIANELTYDYTNLGKGTKETGSSGNSENPNRCFCIYNNSTKISTCPPSGMMDLYTCRKGSPLTISFPHFLYSDSDKSLAPYLELFDDDVKPNESEHQFFIDLESTLNIPVRAQIVIQFNVHYKNEPSLNFTHDYSFLVDNPGPQEAGSAKPLTDFYLPQMWLKSSAEIDERNLSNLKFIQHHLKFITPVTTFIIFGFASILLIMSAKLAYDLTYGPKSRKPLSQDQESRSSLNRNDHGSFLEDKQKYYALQLIEKSQNNNNNNNNKANSRHSSNNDLPTTSKNDDQGGECQPLNG